MGWQHADNYRWECRGGMPARTGGRRVYARCEIIPPAPQWMISIWPQLRRGSGNPKVGCNIASPRIANARSLGCSTTIILAGARDGTKTNTKR